MSSLNRTVEGDVLVHHLPHAAELIDRALVEQHGRSARTLVKEGLLRLTIIALAPRGDMPVHGTSGPVSVHMVQGEAVFHAGGRDYRVGVGDVLVFAAGVEHSARSEQGCTFLLTVVHEPSPGTPPDVLREEGR
jgi:quercetin dioxygenase-like cupin family protein